MEKTEMSVSGGDNEDSYSDKKVFDMSGYQQSTSESVFSERERSEWDEGVFNPIRVDSSSSQYYTTDNYHYSNYPSVYGTASPRPPFLNYNHKNMDSVSQRTLSSSYRQSYLPYDYHDQVYTQSQLSSDVYSLGNPSSMQEENLSFDSRVGCHGDKLSRENMSSSIVGTPPSMEKFNPSLTSSSTPPPLIKTQTSDLLPSNYHQQTSGLRFPYYHINQEQVGIPNSDPLDLRKTDVVEDESLSGITGTKDENILYAADTREEIKRFSHFESTSKTQALEVIKNVKCFQTSDTDVDITEGETTLPRKQSVRVESHGINRLESVLNSAVESNSQSGIVAHSNQTNPLKTEKYNDSSPDNKKSSDSPNKETGDGAIFRDPPVTKQPDMELNRRIEGGSPSKIEEESCEKRLTLSSDKIKHKAPPTVEKGEGQGEEPSKDVSELELKVGGEKIIGSVDKNSDDCGDNMINNFGGVYEDVNGNKGGNKGGNNDKKGIDGEEGVIENTNEKSEMKCTYEREHDDEDEKKNEDEEDDEEEEEDDKDAPNFICGYCGRIFTDNSSLLLHRCAQMTNPAELSDQIQSEGEDSSSVLGKRKTTQEDESVAKKTRCDIEEKNPGDDVTADVKIADSLVQTAEPVRRSSRKNKAKVKMKEWLDDEEDEDPYICGECGQTFDREKLLLRHMKQHNNSDYDDFSGSEASIDQWRPCSQRPKRKAAMRRISYDETSEGLRQSLRGTKRRLKSANSEMLADLYFGFDDKLTNTRRKYPSGNASVANTIVKSCVVCGEVFQNEILLKDHLLEHCEEVPTNEKTFLCAYCDKYFVSNIFLTNHEDVHVDNGDEKLVRAAATNTAVENKYKCTKCEKSFKLKGYLKLHMKTHKVKEYHCSLCDEKFVNKGDYLHHKKSHKVKQEYICELCGKEYTYKSGLSIHMKTHADKEKQTFDCLTCNRSFYSQGHLAIHIKGHKHAGTKKHRCQECGYQVYDEEKLFRHLESHINQDPFVCPFCGKLFMKKSTFVKHKKKHSGENMCDVCGKAFSHRSGLDRHYTIHSGEKPYKCEQCDKSFSQQSNLTTHQRQHSGEKPFMCEICAQSFTNKCSLVRHMTKHSESETAGLTGISMVNKNLMWPREKY